MRLNRALVIFFLITLFIGASVFFLDFIAKRKCGDGICQKREERRKNCPQDCQRKSIQSLISAKKFIDNGGRVDWCKDNQISVDRKVEDGYYDVYVMNLDGTEQRCLTCGNSKIPQENNGQPAWHPSCQYIVFQSQNPELKGIPEIFENLEKRITSPGGGVNNNLWIMDKDGENFWQLTGIEDKKAVLHPHFSHSGTKLIWSEMTDYKVKPSGKWVVRIADIAFGEDIYLENIQTLEPGEMKFYETHGFSPDNETIIFSASEDGYYENLDIYTYNLTSGELEILTDPNLKQWDEHAHFSPDGEKIVWMSSMGISQKIKQQEVLADYWIMDKNGSNKRRLTYFNDPNSDEYLGKPVTAADMAWSPQGNSFLSYLIIDNHTQYENFLIKFK